MVAEPSGAPSIRLASLSRRLVCLIYEAVLLAAVLWLAALLYLFAEHALGARHIRPLFQACLVSVSALYFVPQWVLGGQTLPMKTWRMSVRSADGVPIGSLQAILRFIAAVVGLACFGGGILWAFVDREAQFLHDRLADTRIVQL